MIDPAVLATIPAALQADYKTGAITRVGMLLFRTGQPGIVAHLVESGGLPAATQAISQANPVTSLASFGMQAISVIQNEQIKSMLGTLQSLQLGAMALSGVGIGVSVASYKLIEMRLDRIERQVQAMDAKLDRIAARIEDLHMDAIERDCSALKSACEQADGAWLVPNPERDWREASDRLHELRNLFTKRIRKLIAEGDLAAIEPFVDMAALAAATHVSCRVAAGDIDLAISRAGSFADELSQLLQPVGSASLLNKQLELDGIKIGSVKYAGAFERARPFVERKAALYRDREAMAASAPITLRRVKELDLNGREWLEAARSEKAAPLLLLSGSGASEQIETRDAPT